ncbi:hypothetical protein D6817_03640 [Candidatus Pacearchaeota archaeon]|nr:MAG: hypothetical protein D6817_03640 [Candidatus Pacearchaeota archaeon]
MPFFTKEGDIVDLTELEKRGLLNLKKKTKDESDGYVEVQPANQAGGLADGSAGATQESGLPFSFLDNAGVQHSGMGESSSGSSGILNEVEEKLKDVAHLSVRLDDFEYKLERVSEKLEALEEKVRRLEG